MFFFLLPLYCFAASECVVNGTDFSYLTKKDNFYRYEGKDFGFIFTMNVCGPINEAGDAITGELIGNPKVLSIGKYSTQQPVQDEIGIGFKYSQGADGVSNQWEATIYIDCNPNKTESKITVVKADLDHLKVGFMMEGPDYCPNVKKSLSGGEIFLIILAVIVAVLVIVWVAVLIINIVIRKKKGVYALPITGLFKKEKSQPFSQL